MTTRSGSAAERVIRVSDLRKTYGQTHAVEGVSFDVHRGEVFGLLGPCAAVLAVFLGVCFLVSARFFRWQ